MDLPDREPIPPYCAHCGDPVSTQGRTPKTGKRFCSRPGCKAAKARLRRQGLATDRQPPTECSGCRAALPPRRWRAGDENGRWCDKASCRSKRRAQEEAILEQVDLHRELELARNAIALLATAVEADMEDFLGVSRVVCRECGLTTALRGWPHQREDGSGCRGTRGDGPPRPVTPFAMAMAWPVRRRYLDADQIANLSPNA